MLASKKFISEKFRFFEHERQTRNVSKADSKFHLGRLKKELECKRHSKKFKIHWVYNITLYTIFVFRGKN